MRPVLRLDGRAALAIVNEEGELKGYRVRLRVVEEYNVAFELSEEAKARAEAEVSASDTPPRTQVVSVRRRLITAMTLHIAVIHGGWDVARRSATDSEVASVEVRAGPCQTISVGPAVRLIERVG